MFKKRSLPSSVKTSPKKLISAGASSGSASAASIVDGVAVVLFEDASGRESSVHDAASVAAARREPSELVSKAGDSVVSNSILVVDGVAVVLDAVASGREPTGHAAASEAAASSEPSELVSKAGDSVVRHSILGSAVDDVTVASHGASPGSRGGSVSAVPQAATVADTRESVVDLAPSPSANRARFMANCQPLRVCCNLNLVGVSAAGIRFSFQAIVFVVYPASTQPDRRHVLLVDSTGCAGVTVWGAHVPQFTFATVGTVAKFTRLGMIIHNGKKALSMGRDTNVQFLPNTIETDELKWWRSLALKPFLRIIEVHDCEDDTIVNVAGIVGMISSETKRVRSDNKDLMTMRLTDRSGFVDVRSWNHAETEFRTYLEKPLLLQRVRVTSYAGIKVCELLDGNGTNVVPSFPGQEDLEQYWQE